MLCGDSGKSDEKNHLLFLHKRKWCNGEQNLGQSVRVRWSFPIQKTSQLGKLTHSTTIKEVSWGFGLLVFVFCLGTSGFKLSGVLHLLPAWLSSEHPRTTWHCTHAGVTDPPQRLERARRLIHDLHPGQDRL